MGWDYAIAKSVTSEAEKERMMTIFMNTYNGVTDWEKATKDHGSASVNSMKVSLANMYKKIEKAGGKLADDGSAGPATPATPASKKRKSKSEMAAADDDADTPEISKAKRGRPKKVAVTPKAVKEETVDGEAKDDSQGVKEENVADEFI